MLNLLSFEPGIDEKIDNAFAPIANAWESLILYGVPITEGKTMPIVVILLVCGAAFLLFILDLLI